MKAKKKNLEPNLALQEARTSTPVKKTREELRVDHGHQKNYT